MFGSDDGVHLVCYGLAPEPFEVPIRSEVFKPKWIRLDQKTQDGIRVTLTPLDLDY